MRFVPIAVVLALAPIGAGAQSFAVSAATVSEGVETAEVEALRRSFEDALRQTGGDIVANGSQRAFLSAEFVASLSVAKAGTEWLLAARVSRVRLDRWAARAEVLVKEADEAALAAALADLAGQISLAVRTAPPRMEAKP